MEYFVHKVSVTQPVTEQALVNMVEKGHVMPDDLGCVAGMQEWLPLSDIPEVQPLIGDVSDLLSSYSYLQKIRALSNEIWQDTFLSQELYIAAKEMEHKISVMKNEGRLDAHPYRTEAEALAYFFQAESLLCQDAFKQHREHEECQFIDLLQFGNAARALTLIDKAIALVNEPEMHLRKAFPLASIGREREAMEVVDYVIESFPNDESAQEHAYSLRDQLNDLAQM